MPDGPIDWNDPEVRKSIVAEIKSEENISRKRYAQRQFDVYKNRQDRYILQKLRDEFDDDTVQEMRKILSMNICKPIVDKQSVLYNREPDREFSNASDAELEQIHNLYELSEFNKNQRQINRYYKLGDQAWQWLVPKMGRIISKPIFGHNIDVIPMPDNPEWAQAFIMNVWDLDFRKSFTQIDASFDESLRDYRFNDRQNQKIAEENDRQSLLDRFVVWDREYHFTMNGEGEITDGLLEDGSLRLNPLSEIEPGMLPFVEYVMGKDFEYFLRRGSSLVEFTIDFGAQLSDISNVVRFQNYSQAVVKAIEKPVLIKAGPNKVLFLRQDPTGERPDPTFGFSTPSPDIQGSLNFLEMQLKLELSSLNLDTSSLVMGGDVRQFTSGADRFLAMVKEFEASQQDMDVFRKAEHKAFKIMSAWSNLLQGTTDPVTGEPMLMDELNISSLNQDIDMSIQYSEPSAPKTEDEMLNTIERKLDLGIISKLEAIMMDRGVERERAEEILLELNEGLINVDQAIQAEGEPNDRSE